MQLGEYLSHPHGRQLTLQSAWNAVIRGAKYWIMFPSNERPPGVFVSEDQSEVTSPLSIAEWLLGFHAEARRHPAGMEGVCSAGEVLHVPSGWWHLVVNLSPSIAITQNFVPEAHLTQALSFLKLKTDQISGFAPDLVDPYSLFVDRLQETYPELLGKALRDMAIVQNGKKRKWDDVTGAGIDGTKEVQEKEESAFSFGFEESDASES